jgi:hypothetical protein
VFWVSTALQIGFALLISRKSRGSLMYIQPESRGLRYVSKMCRCTEVRAISGLSG